MTEERLEDLQGFGRRSSDELIEVVHHMHLVVITEIMSDLGPQVPGPRLLIDCSLESHDARKHLRSDAESCIELAGQLT